MEILTIGAAAAGVIGLVSWARSGQWRNAATAAFATAAALMASANLYVSNEIANVTVDGPGVPKGCFVGFARAGHVILSCPVPVAMPPVSN